MRRLALAYLILLGLGSVLAPWIAPYEQTESDLDNVLTGPGAAHWLGTDALGRDVLSRLMFAGRPALAHAALAVAAMLVLAVTTGLAAGYLGGRADRFFRWATDVMLAMPVIIVLLSILTVTGHSLTIAMVSLGVLMAPGPARVVRAAALAVRGENYVAAARIAGLGHGHIMLTHVLPRIAGPVLVQASLACGGALLLDSGLAYLGFGPQPPAATWGSMLTDASALIDAHPWLLVPPGVVIGLAVLAFGLLGDAASEATAAPSIHRHGKAPGRVSPLEKPATGLLDVQELSVALPDEQGWVTVVRNVSLHLHPGEIVGLVGESGCGKSVTGSALLGLIPGGGQVTGGRILLEGEDLTAATPQAWQHIRGARIALVPQEPHSALDPVHTAGQQIAELVGHHRRLSRQAARERAVELLGDVGLPDPESVAGKYPHQLSGGMAQRVAVALALAADPSLLIADEPTTALDANARASLLRLLAGLRDSRGLAILLVSHDWDVISALCRRAYVMYAGQIVETAAAADLRDRPRHPYTAGLLSSSPRHSLPRQRLTAIPGSVPRPRDWPAGCHFSPRCAYATSECTAGPIAMSTLEDGRSSRCLRSVGEPAATGTA